jgi:hypothetical protein
MGAVELDPAVVDPLLHEREGQQVLDALLDDGELKLGQVVRRLGIACLGLGLAHERDPLADEVARRERLGLVGVGLDAAAGGVAEHDDVLHLQRLDGEFQGRRGAVILPVGLVDRHEVGDVADREQLARTGIEDRAGRDPAVAAADDQDLGILAGGELREAPALRREAVLQEGPVPFGQVDGEHHIVSG